MASKGDLSINVIIVAVLALLVLVVLAAIFVTKLGVFEKGVSKEGQTEIAKMRIFYGDCHPSSSAETAFANELTAAGDDAAKDAAKAKFKDASALCKQVTDKDGCSGECIWG